MNWQQVCDDPRLQNLPYKIELNEYGKWLISPARVRHSALQGEIEYLLRLHLQNHGKTLPECAIATPKGTKVADVVWVSPQRFKQIKEQIECSVAPEICVEIISASNSAIEMQEKRALYFGAGAEEVWICDENGQMRFYSPEGKLAQSSRAAEFPAQIIL